MLGSLSLAFCVHCGSSAGDDLFGGGASGAGGGASGAGGAAAQGGLGGTVGSGGGSALGGTAGVGGAPAQGGANPTGGSNTSGGKVSSGGAASGGVASGGVASGGAASGGAASGGVGGVGGAGASAGVGGGQGEGGAGGCDSADTEVCDGVDNDCDGRIDDGDVCPDDCTGFVAHGGRYMACDTSTGQAKASTLCEEQGMRLAWLDSAAENSAVTAAILELSGSAPELLFIGASDAEEEGSWHWIDGSPFWEGEADGAAVDGAFANWSEGRPNDSGTQDCAALIVDHPVDGEPGQWNDTGCTSSRGALCEAP